MTIEGTTLEVLEGRCADPIALVVGVENLARGIGADTGWRPQAAGNRFEDTLRGDPKGPATPTRRARHRAPAKAANVVLRGNGMREIERPVETAVGGARQTIRILVIIVADAPRGADREESIGIAIPIDVDQSGQLGTLHDIHGAGGDIDMQAERFV